MDDLIYFLFLIAWLAFSFYQQSVKKKKKQEQMMAQRERELQQEEQEEYPSYGDESAIEQQKPVEVATPAPGRGTDFKKTLEEILLGEEFVEATKPRPVANEDKPRAKEDRKENLSGGKRNIYQKYYDEEMLEGSQEKIGYEPKKIEDSIEELENDMVLKEEELEEETHEKIDFDLRKAIIYSEIINRRYAN
jgi:hypothetical protein